MATMTETDVGKRIDDLRSEVHRGFDRVDTNCREIRAEMRAGFAQAGAEIGGVRTDSKTEGESLRAEMSAGFARVDTEMRAGFARVDTEFRDLRSEMKAGFDSVHTLMVRFFAGTLGSIIAGVVVLLVSHS